MTSFQHHRRSAPAQMVLPFPTPGREVLLAYRELHVAVNGSEEQRRALGDHVELPRPWEPASCLDPSLRQALWGWLEAVVIWINHDYSWEVAGLIPKCWPLHPHLVHEVAVLADQRRRAGLAMTSDALEEWHRYCLTSFAERMRNRLRAHCEDDHMGWPARPRHNEHLAKDATEHRENAFAHDVEDLTTSERRNGDQLTQHDRPVRLAFLDLATGEIHDKPAAAPTRTRTTKGPRNWLGED